MPFNNEGGARLSWQLMYSDSYILYE